MNLIEQGDRDMSFLICGDFNVPAILTGPDGVDVTHYTNGKPLCGMARWSRTIVNPDQIEVSVDAPVITLWASRLPRVPKSGEIWYVKMRTSANPDSEWKWYQVDPLDVIRPMQNNTLIRLPLVEAKGKVPA
ncbi:hypothetical protein FACS1894110_09850 [Spirochaetia bacterium]|nr:hypothetical protein FACS1894110_09850 [Spirochaetia bacterium]